MRGDECEETEPCEETAVALQQCVDEDAGLMGIGDHLLDDRDSGLRDRC